MGAPLSVLITAGPTHEPIDGVRYLANRSSGRMGIALAEAATSRGLTTTLLLGPSPLAPPEHSQLTTRRFQTTAQLQTLLTELWPSHAVLLMAAAVADYRPARPQAPAAKRPRRGSWSLELEATPDLLAALAARARDDQVTIGFALEPADRLAVSAREKLAAKTVDAIVANPMETIGDELITGTLLLRDGTERTPPQPRCTKRAFADWLLDQVVQIRGMGPTGQAASGSR